MSKMEENINRTFGNKFKRLSSQFRNSMEHLAMTLSLRLNLMSIYKTWVFRSLTTSFMNQFSRISGG